MIRAAAAAIVAAAALVAVVGGAGAHPDRLSADPRIGVSGFGEHPQVLVDQIGTAHIVWNAPGGPKDADAGHDDE